MNNSEETTQDKNLTFTINFSENGAKLKQPPARFLKRERANVTTKEGLEKKLADATVRRHEHEAAMIKRIQERSEECRKIDEKVQVLLQQEALRHQVPGCENIKPISKSQVSKTFQSVAIDFKNISLDLNINGDIK